MSLIIKWEYIEESGHWIKSGWYEISYRRDSNNMYLLSGNSGANVYSFIHQKVEDNLISQETINKNLDFTLHHIDFEDSVHLKDFIETNCFSKNDYEVTNIKYYYDSTQKLIKKKISHHHNEIEFIKYLYSDDKLITELCNSFDYNLIDVSSMLRDYILENDGIPSYKYEYSYYNGSVIRRLYFAASSDLVDKLIEKNNLYEKDKFIVNNSFLLFDKNRAMISIQNKLLSEIRKILNSKYEFSKEEVIPNSQQLPSNYDNYGRIIEERDDVNKKIYKFKYFD